MKRIDLMMGCATASVLLTFCGVAGAAEVPATYVGFQAALRTGAALSFGRYAEELALSTVVPVQFPIYLDLGGKLTQHIFLGAFLGLGIGTVDGGLYGICNDPGTSCSVFTERVGAQMHYQFAPDDRVNPWLGYGIGLERLSHEYKGPLAKVTSVAFGVEWVHLMGGVDFRLNEFFGVGPFADVSMGQYTSIDDGLPDGAYTSLSRDVDKFHGWATVGVRGVFFP